MYSARPPAFAPRSITTGSGVAVRAARGQQPCHELVEAVVDRDADVREADVGRPRPVPATGGETELEQLDARALAAEREVVGADDHVVLADDRLEVAAARLLVDDRLHAERVAPEAEGAVEVGHGHSGVMEGRHGSQAPRWR